MKNEASCQHEVIVPNRGLPFKLFLFEGKDGKYIRDKHWHRSVEIFAVKDGSLNFFLNEKKYHLQAGDFVLVNSNEVHSIYAPDPNETIVLQIPLGSFAGYYTEEQFIWFSHSEKSDDERIFSLLNEMYEQNTECRMGYELQMLSCFYQLEYLLVTRYRKLEVHEELLKNTKQLKRLGVITGYLKEHYTEDISLEKLAGIFGYSPSYLSRMFQKYAKINYKDYLQSVRFEHAVKELEETEHQIGDIALNHGFPNSKAFSNLMRKKYGYLPNEYRKMRDEHLQRVKE
jgi:AraC-like DNA-binding protein/quercetin dioxygenase-like cupin family protein